MAFIIDVFSKYDAWDRAHAVYKFEINGQWYAIKEVQLEWGQPQIGYRIESNSYSSYFIYNTIEEAMEFVRRMKSLN